MGGRRLLQRQRQQWRRERQRQRQLQLRRWLQRQQQRQQQRQVNRKPSKSTTGHRHTARAAVQRAATTRALAHIHPRHTPSSLIAASASGHSYNKERAFSG